MPTWTRAVFGSLAVLVVGACSNKIVLKYEFQQHHTDRYRLSVRATSKIDAPTEQTQRVLTLRADVDQTTVQAGKQARVRTKVIPIEIREDGVLIPTPPPASLEYEVTRSGQITSLVATSGLTPDSSSTLELESLLTGTFPVLPDRPVALRDRWPADLDAKGSMTQLALAGSGTLEGFELIDRRRLARISLSRSGEVRTEQPIGRTKVTLDGKAVVSGTSLWDVDDGRLFSNRSSSHTVFDLSVGGGAEGGTLTVRLVSNITLR